MLSKAGLICAHIVCHTGCGKIKHPVKLIAIWSVTAWNFNAKFPTLVACSYLH